MVFYVYKNTEISVKSRTRESSSAIVGLLWDLLIDFNKLIFYIMKGVIYNQKDLRNYFYNLMFLKCQTSRDCHKQYVIALLQFIYIKFLTITFSYCFLFMKL